MFTNYKVWGIYIYIYTVPLILWRTYLKNQHILPLSFMCEKLFFELSTVSILIPNTFYTVDITAIQFCIVNSCLYILYFNLYVIWSTSFYCRFSESVIYKLVRYSTGNYFLSYTYIWACSNFCWLVWWLCILCSILDRNITVWVRIHDRVDDILFENQGRRGRLLYCIWINNLCMLYESSQELLPVV